MFVEKLELFGFKSFASRTEVPFARGITAIVGPNGCGKSNISDALRWVLGEQNARTLRGERIQDVIFKGTRSAKPLGLAEVVLTVSNDDGTLPLEYTHVAVARRIFRSGESEFGINKVPCRLKDIRDLFAGTGLGSHGYALLERSMVDAILSEKDEARRFLFEEAAGITKYKQRRKESERRLEGVETDLTRIEDMIREIERGVRSLARQAGKVRRWRRFKEELDHHDVRAAWEQWRTLRERSASSESLHARREHEKAEAQGALSILETRRETQRLNLLEHTTRLEEAQRTNEQAQRAIAASREEIRVSSTRAESWADEERDLTSRLERARLRSAQLRTEEEALRPRLAELAAALGAAEAAAEAAASRRAEADQVLRESRAKLQSIQQLTLDLNAAQSGHQRDLEVKRERREAAERRRAGLTVHLEAFTGREAQVSNDRNACETRLESLDQERRDGNLRRDELAAGLESARARLAELLREVADVDQRCAGLSSRLALLSEQKNRHEGFDAAVRALLEARGEFDGLIGVVGEEIRLRPEREALGRAVLGEQVPWVLVRDEDAAVAIIGRLRARGLGGVTFFPLREAGTDPETAAPGTYDPEVVSLFEASPAARPFLGWLAASTRLTGSLEEARRQAGAGLRAVTPEGDVVDAHRVIRLTGGEGHTAEILHRELEIPILTAELAERSARAAELRGEEESTQGRITSEQRDLRAIEERLGELDRERAGLAEQRTGLRTELAMLGEERIRLAQETEQLAAEMRGLEDEIARLAGQAERSGAEVDRARGDFELLARQAEEAERLRDERTREASEKEMEVVRLRSERNTEESRRLTLERETGELRETIDESTRRYEERSREAAEAAQRAAELGAGLGDLEAALRTAEAELTEARGAHQGCQDAIFSLDAEIRAAREALDAVVQALHEEDVERVQTRSTSDRIRDRVLEDHGIDLEGYEPAPDPMPRAPRRRRAASGPVATSEESPDAEGGSAGADLDEEAVARFEGEAVGADELELAELAEGADEAEEADDAEDAEGADGEPAFAVDGLSTFTYTPELRAERMAELRRAMGQMGNLNFLAEEEYSAAKERLDFHSKQASDLRTAREDLLEAIRRINETAGVMFQETFTTVQEHFLGTFDRLFPGGEASLSLVGGDPLEGDIEIAARPRGKRLESIRLLSSGERALTAIALLFAIYLAKPSPVCLLDEVDAPLDDANLDRFLALVRHFSERTQFICITHNKKTMEMADRLFGVTMEEPGISKLVSVHMDAGSTEILDRLTAGPDTAEAGSGPGGSA